MDEEIRKQLSEQAVKIEAIYRSVEKVQKYFLWTLVVSLVVIVLPLVGLLFAIPRFLSTYNSLGL